MTDQLDIFSEAEARKQQGMAAADAGTDEWWRSCALQAVRQIAQTMEEFQAFDLCLRYGLAEPRSANAWGPLLATAAAQKLIEPVGYAPSKRPTTAKSAVRTWRGVSA